MTAFSSVKPVATVSGALAPSGSHASRVGGDGLGPVLPGGRAGDLDDAKAEGFDENHAFACIAARIRQPFDFKDRSVLRDPDGSRPE